MIPSANNAQNGVAITFGAGQGPLPELLAQRSKVWRAVKYTFLALGVLTAVAAFALTGHITLTLFASIALVAIVVGLVAITVFAYRDRKFDKFQQEVASYCLVTQSLLKEIPIQPQSSWKSYKVQIGQAIDNWEKLRHSEHFKYYMKDRLQDPELYIEKLLQIKTLINLAVAHEHFLEEVEKQRPRPADGNSAPYDAIAQRIAQNTQQAIKEYKQNGNRPIPIAILNGDNLVTYVYQYLAVTNTLERVTKEANQNNSLSEVAQQTSLALREILAHFDAGNYVEIPFYCQYSGSKKLLEHISDWNAVKNKIDLFGRGMQPNLNTARLGNVFLQTLQELLLMKNQLEKGADPILPRYCHYTGDDLLIRILKDGVIRKSIAHLNQECQRPTQTPTFRAAATNISQELEVTLKELSRSDNDVPAYCHLDIVKYLKDLIAMDKLSASDFQMTLAHYHRPVIGASIPPARASINLQGILVLFNAAKFRANDTIDDDGIKRKSEEYLPLLKTYIVNLQDSNSQYTDRYNKSASLSLVTKIQDVMRHLIIRFNSPEFLRQNEKIRMSILQDVMKRLIPCFFHCLARMATECQDLYFEYIFKGDRQFLGQVMTLENCLHSWLYERRVAALCEASIFSGDSHSASTHKYMRRVAGPEYGIIDELASAGEEYEKFAVQDVEMVRYRFTMAYSPENIVKGLTETILQGTSKALNYQFFIKWFKDRGFRDQDVIQFDPHDDAKIILKPGALVYFLREMQIIEPNR